MTLLPIADRELRVSARGKATIRMRVLAAVAAFVVAGVILLFQGLGGGPSIVQPGMLIYNALKFIGFALACGGGVFLTSDCLSEEKREGTLGLLFLTDLRGYDIVLGKLLATSLRAFYSLLAVFPIMAVSFILGGVDSVDFRHTLLCLCNTLFFSLALGMVVSVVSRDAQKAMTGTLAGMVIILIGLPVIDSKILDRADSDPSFLGLLSPTHAILHTSAGASHFWICMWVVHLAGWGCLAAASLLAPRTWQERAVGGGAGAKWRIPFLGARPSTNRRRGPGDKDAICWIISRDRWAARLSRLAMAIILGLFALSLVSIWLRPSSTAVASASPTTVTSSTVTTTNASGGVTTVSSSTVSFGSIQSSGIYSLAVFFSGTLSLLLEFWLAAQVARFYVEGKRSGFLELLLVTPVRPAEIVRGHWLALRRLFLAPATAQFLLMLGVGALQVWFMLENMASQPANPGAGWWDSRRGMAVQQCLGVLMGGIAWAIGLFTIAWLAIWTGLTSKRLNVAILKVFWYGKILPWFGVWILFAFGMMSLLGGIGPSTGFRMAVFSLIQVIPQILIIGVNFAIILLTRSSVQKTVATWSSAAT